MKQTLRTLGSDINELGKIWAKGVTTMEHDDSPQDKVHHHDWLIKKIEDRISKLMSGDVEPSLPIPPEKAFEISHIVSPLDKTRDILANPK